MLEKSSGRKSNNVKKRNWAFVVYPDSAPGDWIDKLQQTGLQCAVSPLHDRDINADESIKKPHWHVIATYSGPTSYNVVKALCDSFNAPIPQALEQIRGYYRYLTHKDNPEKAQYEEKDIKTINGFNIADFVELTRSEIDEIKRTIQVIIREKDIIEYAELIDYLYESDMYSELSVASCNTMFFNTYIKSRRHSSKLQYKRSLQHSNLKIDEETGEVIENDVRGDSGADKIF